MRLDGTPPKLLGSKRKGSPFEVVYPRHFLPVRLIRRFLFGFVCHLLTGFKILTTLILPIFIVCTF
jgi:hypothetical protein